MIELPAWSELIKVAPMSAVILIIQAITIYGVFKIMDKAKNKDK